MKQIALALTAAFVLSGAACTSTPPASASKEKIRQGARAIVGTSLIGARGATPEAQEGIDDTVAGVCGAGVWTPSECARHDAAMKTIRTAE